MRNGKFSIILFTQPLQTIDTIYDLQKKAKKFKWTDEAEKAFNKIKKLLISPPVLKALTPDGLFQLESDTLREDMGGTLLQKQGDEWVVIGYHSKRLTKSAKNFGVTELELKGLLVNIHGFMQLLCNRYFEVLVDHKAIEYMIKSKTESPMTRLKTLLLKLNEYTIELKYQKGSKMHTSDALSRLHNFTDTPDTIQPPEIEYTQMPQALVPINTPLSIIHKHIPRQFDIDKIVKNIEIRVINSLELPIQAQDLIKAYQHTTHFRDIYQYITDGKLPSSVKVQNCIRAEALNYVVINNFLFRIDTQKDRDLDKGNLFLLVIPEKYEPFIFNTYHDSLLAGHQGPYHTAMTIRQKFFIHKLMNKVKRYIEACHTCLKTKPKYMKNQPVYGRIPVDYTSMQDLSIDIKTMPQAFGGYHLFLVITCNQTNFTIAVPLRDQTAQTVAEALIY